MKKIPIAGFHVDTEVASEAPANSNVLPRAVLRPNAYFLLDGEWRFALDLKDSGLREAWYVEHSYERTAIWPGSVENHSYEQIARHMRSMKALGCNLVRVHIAGVDPRVYNLADEWGLMLWVEVPSPHTSSQISRENHRAELLRLLALIGTHPSIVIWSLYNEDWGAQDIATNPETQRYIIDLFHYMHINHPQFLVVDNDGWHHVSYEGLLKSDLLTAHLYTPSPARWTDLLDCITQGEMEDVSAFPLVVGDPFFYRGQIPLLVSEWGGFGFKDFLFSLIGTAIYCREKVY